MTLSQRFRDLLRDAINKRIHKDTQMKPIPPDNDAPKEMGKARRSGDESVGTAPSVKDSEGNRVCGRCGGEIVLVNELKGTEACANIECGAKIVDE